MKTLTSKTSKMATRSWYFLSFSDLLWQINTVEVETKAFRFVVSQKCSIKRDIELLVAIHHIWDVSILPA